MAASSFYKTRLAPTPSGYLHQGNVANFLLTAALAQHTGARLLLRIDDSDNDRYRRAYAQHIFDVLQQLNIEYDEGPKNITQLEKTWSQQHRMPLYQKAIQRLIEKDALFACACSRTTIICTCAAKKLSLHTPDAALKLNTTPDAAVTVKNINGTFTTTTLPPNMQQFVVRRKNGLPAYHLCSVVDDVHFGVDLIVRGEDLWPSTVAQQVLAVALGEERFSHIAFVHHPLLQSNNGIKLSKSAGDGRQHAGANFSTDEVEALKKIVKDWMRKIL